MATPLTHPTGQPLYELPAGLTWVHVTARWPNGSVETHAIRVPENEEDWAAAAKVELDVYFMPGATILKVEAPNA